MYQLDVKFTISTSANVTAVFTDFFSRRLQVAEKNQLSKV